MELQWGLRADIRMEITPTIAAQWLQAHNKHNRAQRPSVIRQYGRDMSSGSWLESGEPFTFDWHGQLINGQHRLEAIVASRATIPATVTTGLDPRVRSVVDIHAKRSVRDAFDGAGCTALLGSGSVGANTAAGMWARIFHGMATTKGRETRAELVRFANLYPESGLFALEVFGRHRRVRYITTASVLGAVGRAYYHYDSELGRERLAHFAQVMATGIQQNQHDSTMILWRETLRDYKQGMNSNAQPEIYGKTARVIQAYMDGLTLSKIYMPSEEPFPLPVRTSTDTDTHPGRVVGLFGGSRSGGSDAPAMAASSL